MRRHALIFLCAAATASAAPIKHAGDKPKPIDIKPVADKLTVLRDELGSYYVVPVTDKFKEIDDANNWVFYGDGKTMYQQRIVGFGSSGTERSWDLWSPRVKDRQTAEVEIGIDVPQVSCKGRDGKRPLTELKADEAKTMLARATFYPPLWIRQTHTLARDDDGIYYFVDQLREDYGGAGYRVYVGQKGAMKELDMTNMVSDSAGEIFATKTGQLKIITGKDGKSYWVKGGKKTELTMLEPTDNRYLIYRELGIYGQLGTVCEDL